MSSLFMWFIVFWSVALFVLIAIGGYFMFRKFLKSFPKDDGKSVLDWQAHYIEKTKHLWSKDQLGLLDELVSPVPSLFRDVAKEKIAGKIGELALINHATKMTEPLIIEGYIKATPKRDHKWLINTLKQHNIDITPYMHLFS
mgnify:CR=1 FL=1